MDRVCFSEEMTCELKRSQAHDSPRKVIPDRGESQSPDPWVEGCRHGREREKARETGVLGNAPDNE